MPADHSIDQVGTVPDAPAKESLTLRPARDALAAELLAGKLSPWSFARAYSDAADSHVQALFESATGGRSRGYCLLAVGGYGRGELCPGSDLDLVLLHRGRRRYKEVAQAIWYSLWDEGLRLDHSVRTRSEALAMAKEDLKVALGLLDARVVAGDPAPAEPLLREVRQVWVRQSSTYLKELAEVVAVRHQRSGELAFLLEPDLKQSAGGLRDASALRAIRLALPEVEAAEDPEVQAEADALITATRCALQCRTRSNGDRLVLQEQDVIAPLLNFHDADALMAALAEAGRTITAGLDEAWHRTRVSGRQGASREGELSVEQGIVVRDGEAALSADADVRGDAGLALRLARVAAERHLLIERASLDRLAGSARRPAEPWAPEVLESFVGLLSTGEALVPAVEALDRRRLFELYLPEWRAVRNRPQRNAYHRFTVDRHLLEAVAATASHLHEVDRPDLLVLGALLHDLGKGFPGDHSQVGRDLAENTARRMGLSEKDGAVLSRLVAYHLVLPEFATRRDLDDPSTTRVVARIVEDRRTLALLRALAEADGRATGHAAWGPWKAELVGALTNRVADALDGRPLPSPTSPVPPSSLRGALEHRRLGLAASGRHVTVVAPDQPGLLAAVTGVLALHGCNVLRAAVGAAEGAMAVESYDVEFAFGRVPDWERVESDVAATLAGSLDIETRLSEQESAYARGRRPEAAAEAQVSVHIDSSTSELATIVEVRAPDRLGLLHRITCVLAGADLDVAAALVDTLGHEVVDAFYVCGRDGDKRSLPHQTASRLPTLLREVLVHV